MAVIPHLLPWTPESTQTGGVVKVGLDKLLDFIFGDSGWMIPAVEDGVKPEVVDGTLVVAEFEILIEVKNEKNRML